MTHDVSDEILFAWRDGRLSPEQAELVQLHARECSLCREKLARWNLLSTLLFAEKDAVLPQGFSANVMRRIRREELAEKEGRFSVFSRFMPRSLAVRAVLAAAVVAIALLPFINRGENAAVAAQEAEFLRAAMQYYDSPGQEMESYYAGIKEMTEEDV